MNWNHDTPACISRYITNRISNGVLTLLDPAAGSGVLIDAVFAQYEPDVTVAIEVDAKRAYALKENYAHAGMDSVRVYEDDFLDAVYQKGWFNTGGSVGPVDLVVMNPPFGARRGRWATATTEEREFASTANNIPIEVRFVGAAMRCLRPGGRLMAVVPASIVNGASGKKVREAMMARGRIEEVVEFSAGRFARFEGRVFLVVYRHQGKAENMAVTSVRGEAECKRVISGERVRAANRIDPSYLIAEQELLQVRHVTENFQWRRLHEIAEVERGNHRLPYPSYALHTTMFVDAIIAWNVDASGEGERVSLESLRVRLGEITDRFAIARVGRNCVGTFGPVIGNFSGEASECMFVIRKRPRLEINGLELLFAIRVALTSGLVKDLLDRGTGAKFIAGADLRATWVPTALAVELRGLYEKYHKARMVGDRQSIIEIEELAAGEVRRMAVAKSVPEAESAE